MKVLNVVIYTIMIAIAVTGFVQVIDASVFSVFDGGILAAIPLAKIKELRTKRAGLAEEARKILEESGDEGLSEENETRWNALMGEADQLKVTIDQEERMLDLESNLGEAQPLRSTPAAGEGEPEENEVRARYSQAFRNYIRSTHGHIDPEDRQVLQTGMVEARALSVGTPAAGGYTVPEDFRNTMEEAMLAFGGMRASGATIMRTESGADLPMPTSNDTSNEGEIIAENAQHNEQDVAFGQVILQSFMYSSKIVRVSFQLMQDGAFDLESFLGRKLAERIARITNRHFTVGTGTGQPLGVVNAAAAGVTGAATTAIAYDELIDLEHSVDPAYRMNARWMFHDTTLKAIKKLKDSQDRPLWLPGIALKEPDTILSKPYTINQHMPVMAADAKSVLFGDFSKYMIRDSRDVNLIVFREKYADYLQVGFLSFSRHDGDLLDAGTGPIKVFANAS